jgi:hypothetical protein
MTQMSPPDWRRRKLKHNHAFMVHHRAQLS